MHVGWFQRGKMASGFCLRLVDLVVCHFFCTPLVCCSHITVFTLQSPLALIVGRGAACTW